jgi:hypothetical protein
MGKRFFAKIFLADPYPVAPRVPLPWEALTVDKNSRSIGDQVEREWNMANEFRLLAAPGSVPAPLGKSTTARTIVWEEVSGIRLDHFVRRSRWLDPKGKTAMLALFQAGAWLRGIHDASARGNEGIDILTVGEATRNLVEKQGLSASKHANFGCHLLEKALAPLGIAEKLLVPAALSHGDFSLSNLMWSKAMDQLFVFDFEHSDRRSICHDLVTIMFDFRVQLLNPLIPKRVILSLEKSFWAGYGPIPRETRVLVQAVALSRIFYQALPRLSTRRKRRGRLAGLYATIYRRFFEDFVITRRLNACVR